MVTNNLIFALTGGDPGAAGSGQSGGNGGNGGPNGPIGIQPSTGSNGGKGGDRSSGGSGGAAGDARGIYIYYGSGTRMINNVISNISAEINGAVAGPDGILAGAGGLPGAPGGLPGADGTLTGSKTDGADGFAYGIFNLYGDENVMVANNILTGPNPGAPNSFGVFSKYYLVPLINNDLWRWNTLYGSDFVTLIPVNSLNLDPRFIDEQNGDFHLWSNSPCVDRGDNSIAGLPVTDQEGKPRIINGNFLEAAIIDLGVFEDEYDLLFSFTPLIILP